MSEENTSPTEQKLLTTIQAFTRELRNAPTRQPVNLDSRLEQDLGLDSLSRVELIGRLEAAFRTRLPERTFSEAETPRDLLRAISGAGRAEPAALTRTELAREGIADIPQDAGTLTDVLDWHAHRQPDHPHIRLLEDDADETGEPRVISYAELRAGALRIAAALQQRGLAPGDTVALMLPTSGDYFFSFFGALYAGGIPVPIYPPTRPSQLADHLRRQAGILDNAQCRFLLTVAQAKPLARVLRSRIDSLRDVIVAAEVHRPGAFSLPRIESDQTALLQYTSGSTGRPKGVILSHANLLANIRACGAAIEADSSDVFVSWLPLYHDMGLIGAWLGSLYFGAQLVIMSPLSFLARPARWLHALHHFGGTLSAAPNFAYQLCLSRIQEQELKGLDLSRWRIAMNGAEAVSPDTVETFIERFSAYGFSAEAMFPVYGLAECSVGLAFPTLHQPPRIDRILRETFSRHGRAEPAADAQADSMRFVGCGHALPGHEIRIVDSDGHELPERIQGRVQFRGPSTTRGYYRNPEATAGLFDGSWLESGDLGYFAAGELYIAGRSKDLIVRGGRNIYPQELEEAVGPIPGIRKGRVAVFASTDNVRQTERLVILAETRESDPAIRERLRQQINDVSRELTLVPPDEILLAPPGTVLKTSSGKIRRAACRSLYEEGRIGERTRGPWLQLAGMLLATLPRLLGQQWRRLAGLGYALYAQLLFHVLAVIVTLGVFVLPKPGWRHALLHGCARTLARLSATRLVVQGLRNLPPVDRPCVFVSNHASYLDSYVITAALPRPVRFVTKAELAERWLPRTFLRRINVLFVERHDSARSIQDQQSAADAASRGDSLLYFPEGTFTRAAGLRRFRMGAFVTAAEADLPLVPIALRGTRAILPGTSWYARRGTIQVSVGEAIDPATQRRPGESDWQLAVRLRDLVREQILRDCGEADMGHEPVFAPPRNQAHRGS